MSTNRLVRLLGLGVALLAAPAIASADVLNFTFNGTANQATNGYSIGQAVSFTFTLRSFGVQTPVGSASVNNLYQWQEELSTDPELFASVSGTGLSGTWTRPAIDNFSPYSFITSFANGELGFFAGTDSFPANDTGLTVNGADFISLYFYATFTGLSNRLASISSTLPDPTAYFGANLIGTYAVLSQNIADLNTSVSTTFFTLTSLTISAVPEPSSFAAIAGAIALGGVLVRRRRRA